METFEYFLKINPYNIIIDDRGGRVGRYAVYKNECCVNDCLNKKQAYSLCKTIVKETERSWQESPHPSEAYNEMRAVDYDRYMKNHVEAFNDY
jgi:ABC-type enterochelin transport system substrate-binding protein